MLKTILQAFSLLFCLNFIPLSLATAAPVSTLPAAVSAIAPEYHHHDALEKFIVDYYEIDHDNLETTRYYYNYIDVNQDGQEEIFVLVTGPYTSGTGGSSGLWLVPTTDGLALNQSFTMLHAPIILSEKITNGCQELVVLRAGGGAKAEYVTLTCSDGYYQTVNEGTPLSEEAYAALVGQAILANSTLEYTSQQNTPHTIHVYNLN